MQAAFSRPRLHHYGSEVYWSKPEVIRSGINGGLTEHRTVLDKPVEDMIKIDEQCWNTFLTAFSSCFITGFKFVSFLLQENRWRKRGIALMPLKYVHHYMGFNFSVLLSIYYADGSVAISHGGIEMGQGIHTRVSHFVSEMYCVTLICVGLELTSISVSDFKEIEWNRIWVRNEM